MSIKLPKIVIIGRPNVGKSTLINTLLNRQQAVTYDQPGVTRDILEFQFKHENQHVLLVDTGGLLEGQGKSSPFQSEIELRVKKLLKDADKIIFVVDSKVGVHPLDKSISKWMFKNGLNCLVAINKVDDGSSEVFLEDFHRIGFKEYLPISSINKRGIKPLVKWIFDGISNYKFDSDAISNALKVSFVGRPNVGKSSLFNAIINQEKAIVSDVAGTTRDTVDTVYKTQGNYFRFIDTAGVKKRSKMSDSIEFFSINRTERTIHQSDLVIVVLDATKGISMQDKKIINTVINAHKNMIIFINKWDAIPEKTDQVRRDFEILIKAGIPKLEYFPLIFGSATTHHHLGKLITGIQSIMEESRKRIPTAEFNRFIEYAIKPYSVPSRYNKRIKIYYATQTDILPITIVFSVNSPDDIKNEYLRYLEKRIRGAFGGLKGCAIRLLFKKH
jgi:GTP-binding protein